nr:helix-turn-helix transcriptional regulator [Anaerosphaera multitolerans]
MAREKRGITQEKAAELLNITSKTLRAYELDITVPNENMVKEMAKIYNDTSLGYKHLAHIDRIGTLPKIKIRSLEGAFLSVCKEKKDFALIVDEALDIVSDGVIEEHELPTWEKCKKEGKELVGAILSLFCCEK